MTLVCKSVGIWDGIVYPIYGFGVKIIPDINPIYVVLERSCPGDLKNVSYVGVGLVLTCSDLILSYGWGGLSKNLVKPMGLTISKIHDVDYQMPLSCGQDDPLNILKNAFLAVY